jgi:hypothetical protein
LEFNMARVSIDSLQSSESSSKSGRSAKSASKAKAAKPDGAGLDSKQKVKAAIAVGVIILAGAFIAWNSGLFESAPKIDANAAPDATPQETQAFQESQKQAEQQQQKTTGNTRLPPMPLGSN